MDELLTTDGVLRRLRDVMEAAAPNYLQLQRSAQEARFPCEKLAGVWKFRAADLDEITAVLVSRPRRIRKAKAINA